MTVGTEVRCSPGGRGRVILCAGTQAVVVFRRAVRLIELADVVEIIVPIKGHGIVPTCPIGTWKMPGPAPAYSHAGAGRGSAVAGTGVPGGT